MNRPVDVLVLCEHPTLNGGERSYLAIAPLVAKLGWRVVFAAPPSGDLADALSARRYESTPLSWPAGSSPAVRREAIAASLARVRPRLAHANSLAMSRLLGPMTESLAAPTLGHIRDIVGLSRQAVDDVNRCDRLLAVSRATRAFHLGQGLDPHRVSVVHNGVDTEQFRPRRSNGWLHRELRIDRGASLVVAIGQIGPRKGLDITLEAFARLEKSGVDAHLLILGSRQSGKLEAIEYEARLRAASREAPLAGRVHFLGFRHDVDRLLNEATLVMHAARQEPLGRVVLEACAAGTPLIATRVGGTEEMLPPELADRLLVPVDDPAGLAEAALRLLLHPEERSQAAVAAREFVATRFSIETAARALSGEYEALLKSFRSRGAPVGRGR